VVLVEFTIEPFVEGQPGPHVTSAVDAVRALGAEVEFGPFGTSCTVPDHQAGAVCKAAIDAALANGATHISLHTEYLDDPEHNAGHDTGVSANPETA
jgi:uncharacterized protein YqgV (UPF0045/DUF77 family)